MGIVYLMTCVCSNYYVGKTKRHFWQWICDHVSAIKEGVISCLLLEDMERGNTNPHSVRFFAFERIHTNIWGGDWDGLILQREARWIHHLGAAQSPGLNDATSFKAFFFKASLDFSRFLLTLSPSLIHVCISLV